MARHRRAYLRHVRPRARGARPSAATWIGAPAHIGGPVVARPEYDLAIIGAGAGGLIAARFAAQLGARVLLAERDRIGGDCTWTGCVPSKSLIRVAKAAHEVRTAARFGIQGASCTVDMPRVRDYVQGKVQQIYLPTSTEALGREGIEVALGPASFQDDRTLRIEERSIVAR